MNQRRIGFRSGDLVPDSEDGPPAIQLARRTGQLLAVRYFVMALIEPHAERTLEHLIASYKTGSSMGEEEYLEALSERIAKLQLDTEAYMEGFKEELSDALLMLRLELLGPEPEPESDA